MRKPRLGLMNPWPGWLIVTGGLQLCRPTYTARYGVTVEKSKTNTNGGVDSVYLCKIYIEAFPFSAYMDSPGLSTIVKFYTSTILPYNYSKQPSCKGFTNLQLPNHLVGVLSQTYLDPNDSLFYQFAGQFV